MRPANMIGAMLLVMNSITGLPRHAGGSPRPVLLGRLLLLFFVGSSIRPIRKPMRLMSSDTPCSHSSAKPSGTSA